MNIISTNDLYIQYLEIIDLILKSKKKYLMKKSLILLKKKIKKNN